MDGSSRLRSILFLFCVAAMAGRLLLEHWFLRRRRLLLITLLVASCPAGCGQQQLQDMTDYVYGACNGNTYQTGSGFGQNLQTVVSSLLTNVVAAGGEPYYLTSITDSSDNSTWVYGAYQCRGDLSAQDCDTCVQTITTYGCTNGNAIGMRVQLRGCYYRYENYDFTPPDYTLFHNHYNCSSQENASTVYQSELNASLYSVATIAPVEGGYFAINIGSAYALGQCLGYLSSYECSTCLFQSSNRSSICNTSSSGYFYYVSCYYLFSNSTFRLDNSSAVNGSASLILAPSPAPISPSAAGVPEASAASNVFSPTVAGGLDDRSLSTAAIAGISIASVSVVIVVAAICVVRAINRRRYGLRVMGGSRPFLKISSSSEFSIKELQTATEKFHSRNKLGQGGFGIVYKGMLRNSEEVAIKIISPGSGSQNEVDFMNEAKLIASVQHRNLIQLLGYAMDDFQWYLVYEYLPNRSLDLHLFGNSCSDEFETRQLDWMTRFNIINGIARGLCYLHEESHVRIVHRDIKAGNILLDDNLEPKIADFGLARLFADDVSHLTTAVAGTLGYVAPEYAMGGQLSEKVDVYSFGLVTLEIVSGRRAIKTEVADLEQTHILQWAWALYERKQVLEMVDSRILMEEESEELRGEIERAVQVALLCTQTKPHERPTMSEVCRMLRNQSSLVDLPSRPGIVSMGIFSASIADSHTYSADQ